MRTLLYSILSVTLLIGFSGCSSLTKMPNPFSGIKQEPRRSVAVWSPAARVVSGVPERGFAARVTFFGNDSKKGVKIDGDVVVFAFDEYPYRSANDNRPDKTYPFLEEDLKQVHSYSKKLGHSYSMWVPWDNDGPEGERKTVSLIVKYIPKNGSSPFTSGQAKCVLPGKEPVFIANRSYEEGPISQVNYEFGRNDRSNEQIPPGFRDWTKQVSSPEEREIRTTNNRPTQMDKTTIPISGNAYTDSLQNNPVSGPVELAAAQTEWNPQAPMPPNNFAPQYALPKTDPTPTDFAPATFSSLARTEQQGNTRITYSKIGYAGVGTNPLSRNKQL